MRKGTYGRLMVGLLVAITLLVSSAVPSHAWSQGSRHGGGWHGGGWHGGWHGGCCWGGWWWGPGAFVGGLALGAAVAGTYPYPYYYAPPPIVYQQAPVYVPPPAPPIQREVVYPNGKYVLYGDGVTQAWQWVWISAAPTVPPPQR